LRIERWALALAAFAFAGAAHAGAQKYEVLSASVRASLARAVNERATFDDKGGNDLAHPPDPHPKTCVHAEAASPAQRSNRCEREST